MTFRSKTILGIAAIEAALLLILIWTVLSYIHNSTEDELVKRAGITAKLIATITRDSVISTDLASLESFLSKVMDNPGIAYVRIHGRNRILAEAGDQKSLQRRFKQDASVPDIDDGVFDTSAEIAEAGHILGRIEVGIDFGEFDKTFAAAKRRVFLIAFVMMFFSAIFSFFLGSILVRQLKGLSDASERIAKGELGFRINVTARDEIGKVAESFNFMADSLAKDNAERLKAEVALRESEGRLRSITENISDTIIMSDSAGRITYVNRLHPGLTHEQVLSSTVFDFVPEEQIPTVKKALADVFERGEACSYESLGPGHHGEMNVYAVSVSPVFAGGRVISAVFLARDVTEKIRTEKELLKIKKLESIGVLAGGIAHDFNNILAAILGNINLALFDKTLNDRTKSLLEESEKASIRASHLTQQLLTFAKGGEPVRELASLESVIRDSAGFVLHGYRVVCKFSIPKDLWLVDIDKGQISQVIQNIVLNASQAMPEGGTITITCDNFSTSDSDLLPYARAGKYVRVAIQDTGIGMPANVVDKIFDPYFSTKQEGSGLGLAITQSIINRHNGYITVKSTPGTGTTFSIYLPASEERHVFQSAESEKAQAVPKATILIMDDEEMVRKVLRDMLIALGHEVILTGDGKEAVKIYLDALGSDKPISTVIMDLTIPGGMGGQEAVKEILKIDPKAKVIVSSGYSNDPVVANYEDYGFRGAISKPFKLQELSRVIMKAL
ncbi:MAG TPA: ATP-binding protein [Thermodesulfovibrionales bacterium]|nr:ATP-binding protein [Thermodesulfovibrionales bacterium]